MSKKPSILYMDDDPALLAMVGRFFEAKGYTVILAEDGEIGLNIFKKKKPDLILVDLVMPKVDGFQVLQTVHSESPETPIIVISGEGEMADVIQALRMGAWNYHAKPIENFDIIDHAVSQALEKARLVQENKAYQKGLESKLATIIENFEGFIFTVDSKCRITYMNPSLVEHIGADLSGENCNKVIFGSEEKCQWCQGSSSFTGETGRYELHDPKDGRWYYTVQSPVFDEEGEIIERQIVLYDITERKKAVLELEEREEYLRKENIRLRASMTDRYKFGSIIGKSQIMQEVYETIINAAATDASVIIYGESGTGKELVAKEIHDHSDRKEKPLIYVNCGAIPENLIESEFFGYKKGAFTGANKDKHGYLDLAYDGTLFLDEVGEIPINMQVKLLRAIEGGGYTPVGSTETKKPDVRIIAATNRELKEMVRQGKMRQDFLYRIHIIPVSLPPLRDRKEDIPLLVEHFLKEYDADKIPPLTQQVSRALQQYDWPGNVRELQNTINRFVTLKKLDFMHLDLTDESLVESDIAIEFEERPLAELLEEFEKKVLLKCLDSVSWHQGNAADKLKIDRKTLYRKMKQYQIDKASEQ